MLKPVKLAKLQQNQPIVDKEGRPVTWFQRLLNGNTDNVEYALNQVLAIPEIRTAIDAANAATAAAQAAATSAQGAADDAQAQAAQAEAAAMAQAREQALANSYIDPVAVLSSTPTTISVTAHTRLYADGTSVPVNAGTTPATAAGDTDYVYYLDPMRAGGAVTYQVATDQPTQGGAVHVVGAVIIPATGTAAGGRGPRPSGYVEP